MPRVRLALFGELDQRQDRSADDSRTVAVQEGGFTVQASAYGNPVTYTNDDRAFFAVDGDPETAWVVAAFAEARGEFLEFNFDSATQVSEMTFVQPQGVANRHVTEVEIRASGPSFEDLVLGRFALGAQSHSLAGQRVEFDATTVSQLQVETTDQALGSHRADLADMSESGLCWRLVSPWSIFRNGIFRPLSSERWRLWVSGVRAGGIVRRCMRLCCWVWQRCRSWLSRGDSVIRPTLCGRSNSRMSISSRCWLCCCSSPTI